MRIKYFVVDGVVYLEVVVEGRVIGTAIQALEIHSEYGLFNMMSIQI